MIDKLLALFGLASTATQAARPPLLAYFVAVPLAYFAAEILEAATFMIQWASFGYVSRWAISVAFRTLGVVGGISILHGLVRTIVFRDDLSYSGWLRKALLG